MKHTLTSPRAVSEILADEGITLSHALGQNFLVNGAIIDKILNLSEVSNEDHILEVGPGIGALTVPLLETGAKVTSIEKDPRLKNLLLKHTDFASGRFSLIEGDALEVVSDNVQSRKLTEVSSVEECSKLVANLPYNIAATLVLDVFANLASINSVTVMVQKEVAERMNAKVGSKNYGAYTVKLQLYAVVAGNFFVGRNNFLPHPRVDSTVIRLNRCDRGCLESEVKNACIVADAAFFSRRKTIFNSCKTYFSSQRIKHRSNSLELGMSGSILAWLESCGVDPQIRGEQLELEDFINLGKNIDLLHNP